MLLGLGLLLVIDPYRDSRRCIMTSESAAALFGFSLLTSCLFLGQAGGKVMDSYPALIMEWDSNHLTASPFSSALPTRLRLSQ